MTRTDQDLLAAFEPTIRFTQGEMFFPSAVEPYLAEADLWVGRERERTFDRRCRPGHAGTSRVHQRAAR